ncbi:hypothetical protein DY000_02004124 [Brassica cretica]|uniref:Uncharacterized protein n=1 Tax=Brassica cretica TaxID=69181 RepID=A0ABQ7CBG0_BRACR|nr:hypothetical protein DY000_02004124 [Brassica cretica]
MAKKAEQLMKVPLLRLGLHLRQHREPDCTRKCHNTRESSRINKTLDRLRCL